MVSSAADLVKRISISDILLFKTETSKKKMTPYGYQYVMKIIEFHFLFHKKLRHCQVCWLPLWYFSTTHPPPPTILISWQYWHQSLVSCQGTSILLWPWSWTRHFRRKMAQAALEILLCSVFFFFFLHQDEDVALVAGWSRLMTRCQIDDTFGNIHVDAKELTTDRLVMIIIWSANGWWW